MVKIFIHCFICLIIISCSQSEKKDYIQIQWVDSLTGDYSFTENWDYNDYIFLNDFGQLVCDGLCPEEIINMRDEQGRIYKDSIGRYYQFVDTTHVYHTIESEARCYEWTGTNYIEAIKMSNDSIKAYTLCNPATHSSLILEMIDNKCFARIELNSVTPSGQQIFNCNGGYIKIDKYLWKENIMKAEFDLSFENNLQPSDSLWWKGKIYTTINENKLSL